jgi:ornithine lipid ester-linked acyl 2-hydroxylase
MRNGRRVLDLANRHLARSSPMGDRPVFDPRDFEWIERVEAASPLIRGELDHVLRDPSRIPEFRQVSKDQAHLAPEGMWKTYFFYAYGHRAEGNCERCPITARIVSSIPGMQTAFFSILAPGARIKPHRGPHAGVLRYHLGLRVPAADERCAIRVDDQILRWGVGESLVFDDTYEHEAWNETDAPRAVLFVDFERPLEGVARRLNRGFTRLVAMSPFVREGVENFERWDELYGERSPAARRA